MLDKTSQEYQYIKNTINSLKKRFKFYEDYIIDLRDRIDYSGYDNESDNVDGLTVVQLISRERLADAYASQFWIDDQIDTLEKILEL